jgi:hypothetical protein
MAEGTAIEACLDAQDFALYSAGAQVIILGRKLAENL